MTEGAQGKRARGGEVTKPEEKEPAPAPGCLDSATAAHKVKVVLRPIDTGRPEEYDSWRCAAKASLVGAGPQPARVMGYLAAVEDRTAYPDAQLQALVQAEADVCTLASAALGVGRWQSGCARRPHSLQAP